MTIDAVRTKILTLQQVVYEAEDRAEQFQWEVDIERQARETVNTNESLFEND